ncbi:MAG TPA: hypothetical protein V6D50_20940 [Chroococcales cyanobacterium]
MTEETQHLLPSKINAKCSDRSLALARIAIAQFINRARSHPN